MKFENMSMAEIVTSVPQAATVLEIHKLDYCCGGKRKLSDAIGEDASRMRDIIADLELIVSKKGAAADVNSYSLAQLVDYIVENHHQYIRNNAPLIFRHLEKVIQKHGEKYKWLSGIKMLFKELICDLEHHLLKEEVVLFPQIKKVESAAYGESRPEEMLTLKGPVRIMVIEHDEAGAVMEEIRLLSGNYSPPEGACTTFRLLLDELRMFEADLHYHVHLENNILFPKAMELQGRMNNNKF
jgi:regulator of cell morphogenesis and NO signaling